MKELIKKAFKEKDRWDKNFSADDLKQLSSGHFLPIAGDDELVTSGLAGSTDDFVASRDDSGDFRVVSREYSPSEARRLGWLDQTKLTGFPWTEEGSRKRINRIKKLIVTLPVPKDSSSKERSALFDKHIRSGGAAQVLLKKPLLFTTSPGEVQLVYPRPENPWNDAGFDFRYAGETYGGKEVAWMRPSAELDRKYRKTLHALQTKQAKVYNYGNPVIGQSFFDDESPIKFVKDQNSGDDTISAFFTGVNSVVAPDGESNSPAHKGMDMTNISELVSNSLSSDKEALKAYLARYAKNMEEYKKKHGKYPRQRIIGHSRGGGGALEFMEALSKEYPKLPRVDEYIGLDPYDVPGAKDKNVRRKNKTYVAKRSIIVRPKRTGFFDSDSSDMDVDGKIGFKDRLYPGFANLLVRFARRMNPFSRYNSIGVAIPGVHHSSSPEMLRVALKLTGAKSKRQARKILQEMYDQSDPALIEAENSPLYGDYSEPIYEKAASEFLKLVSGKSRNILQEHPCESIIR